MAADIELSTLKIAGEASCVGGKHPDPPLDSYPLLTWSPRHERHGAKVCTEDGKASVEAIALAAVETQDYDRLASLFGTTPDHVAQAVDYAIEAGFLGMRG